MSGPAAPVPRAPVRAAPEHAPPPRQQPRRPLVGVLGGMGPAATVDFYDKLVRATPAERDQDHLRVVMWADPTVPDRSAALLAGGHDPTEQLEHGARVLADAGADLIAIPCNTAHAFVAGLADRVGVPLVHMIQETAAEVRAAEPRVTRVGLLATTGTVRSRLYQDALADGVEVLLPDDEQQAALMDAIHLVKAAGPVAAARDAVARVAEDLAFLGAQLLVAGCTELPLVLDPEVVRPPIVDPAQVLARAVVLRAGGAGRTPTRPVRAPRRIG